MRLIGSLLFLLVVSCFVYGKERANVALIYDGPMQQEDLLSVKVQEELISLLGDERDLHFFAVEDSWTSKGNRENVRGALFDQNIDLVITMGVLSSYELLMQKELSKPAVVGYNLNIFFGEDAPFPIQKSSKIAFYQTPLAVKEVKRFADIVKAKTLAFVGDASFIGDPDFPLIRDKIVEKVSSLGLAAVFAFVTDTGAPALELVDKEQVDGVVFLPTWRLGDKAFKALIQGMNDRNLPTFSYGGEKEVLEGVLMTMTPKEEVRRVARRIALDAQELLLSGNNDEMVFNFSRAKELIINERTAKKIGIDLPWTVLREAVFVNKVIPSKRDILTFLEASQLAVDNNLELLREDFSIKSGWQDVLRSFSYLMPQVGTHLEGRKINSNAARSGFGQKPENLIRGTLSVSQMLYDERRVADFSVEKKLQAAREYGRNAFELDITLDTALAYLTLLRVQADYRIAEENVALSKANLKRAHELVDSGQARLSEVYRWESELASNRDHLVEVHALIENLKTAFNRLLNRPLNLPVVLEDLSPFDSGLAFDYGHLLPLINTPLKFSRFKEVMIGLARRNSFSIKQIDAEIASWKRELVAAKRSYYLPEFSLFGEFSNNLYRGGVGNAPPPGISNGTMESAIGVAISYPLFLGGRKNSEKNKAFFEVQRLKTDKASMIEKIDETVIQSIDNMQASYEGIFLAKTGAEAAEKNLVIVTNSYARGVVSIVELLDAQNTMIVSKQTYCHSLYDYLIDYMEFQRATSQFNFLLTQEEKETFTQFLNASLQNKERQ